MKRVFDVLAAGLVLVLLTPVLLALTVALTIHLRGNPFFAHERVTRHGRLFKCLKFRTMQKARPGEEAEAARADFKNGTEARTTPFTAWLRRTSLDELPQLINVLIGDMSIVGPRPVVAAELNRHFGPTARILISVRPGMTGLWAVSGRSEIPYPERTQIELRYVMRISLWQDMRIIFQSVRTVITGKGAM